MRRGRLANLRTAVLLAAGFVALRVVYRLIFGGGDGDGLLIVNLPRVPLAGPFAHIILLGPITSGGVLSAAVGALPFAALIVALALIGVAIDLRALLTRGSVRGPIRSIARALVIAWSTFPALRDSVVRVRVARELRGERSLASLIVPILEQTVERAIALGASMEVRGFAATRRPDPDCEHPVVMTDAALGVEGTWLLEAVDLRLAPGTLTLVTGPTGSGKSTLLHAMSGLFHHQSGGEQDGTITVGGADRIATPPRETAGFVGVVSQSVRLSFVAETVAEELGFALAIRGVAPEIVRARAAEIAGELGIPRLLDRDIAALSAGEACLVALGAALVSRPVLMLVDEPLADLDAAARERVVDVLGRLAHGAGVCVVVAEHRFDEWHGVADDRLELADGLVRRVELPVGEHAAERGAERPGESAVERLAPAATPRSDVDPVARVHRATVAYGERVVVDEVSLTLRAGEVVALTGPNGAGKSSLLQAIARPSTRGTVTIDGIDVGALGRRSRRRHRHESVALVPEAFDDLLFATTVAAECRRVDRTASARHDTTFGTAPTFLGYLGVTDAGEARRLLDRHPRDLSAGQRLCLVLAIQSSARARVLLIDEPTRGLDAAARALVGAALLRAAAAGAAVMVATHDRDFAARYASRTVELESGRIRVPARTGTGTGTP
jgi:energy-coupling factor transport system ATP-binding protein